MQLLIDPAGAVRCLYGEEIDLSRLGRLSIARASTLEPDAAGNWWADLSAVGGPTLGPFQQRSHALREEVAWLLANWLVRPAAR